VIYTYDIELSESEKKSGHSTHRHHEGVLSKDIGASTLALSVNHKRNIINAWCAASYLTHSIHSTLRSWPIVLPTGHSYPPVRETIRNVRGPSKVRIAHQSPAGGRFWIGLCGQPSLPHSFIGMEWATMAICEGQEGALGSLQMRVIDTLSLRTLPWSERVDPTYALSKEANFLHNQAHKWRFAYIALASDAAMIAVIANDYIDLFDFAIP
jgi:hypothetical protein